MPDEIDAALNAFLGVDSQGKPAREQTAYNMGICDIRALDKLRDRFHEFYTMSYSDKGMLFQAYDVGQQVFVVVEGYLAEATRKKVWKQFSEARKNIEDFFKKWGDIQPEEEGWTEEQLTYLNAREIEYQKLRDTVFGLIRLVYAAKHSAGLRIPTSRLRNDQELLDELMARPQEGKEAKGKKKARKCESDDDRRPAEALGEQAPEEAPGL